MKNGRSYFKAASAVAARQRSWPTSLGGAGGGGEHIIGLDNAGGFWTQARVTRVLGLN